MTRPPVASAIRPLAGPDLPGPDQSSPDSPASGRPAAFRRMLRWPGKPADPRETGDSRETGDALGADGTGRRARRAILGILISLFLIAPAVVNVLKGPTPRTLLVLAVVIAFTVIVLRIVMTPTRPTQVSWVWLVVIVGLGIAMFALTGQQDSGGFTALAIAAAACGRFTASLRPAVFGAVTCSVAGLVTGGIDHYNQGSLVAALILPPMGAFLAYTAGKRNESVATLRRTRAELARVAVAEERLRIARDLHDLLGHSLSLITLKAELSRRVIDTDPARAAREIAELETVARQSLSDVREAVAGYRQPDLATELGAARQLLTLAGVACQITAPAALGLPGEVDAVAAWTIREGITNVVRHAQATSAAITVTAGPDLVTVEISDNGTCGRAAPRPSGSGLAGLGERVRALGGSLAAGPVRPRGFRLLVTIPAAGPDSGSAAGTAP